MAQSSRDKILNRIKNKTREEQQNSSSGFHFLKQYHQPLIQTFEEKLTAVNGTFLSVKNTYEFQQQLNKLLNQKAWTNIYCNEPAIQKLLTIGFSESLGNETEAAITGCEYLVAQTGSAILSTTQTKSRRSFAYAPVHIIVAFRNQLVGQIEEGLNRLAEKYKSNLPSQITTITGPSRTADIEKTLVLGAHGPRELIIFYIDE